jgi:hypothetical protein
MESELVATIIIDMNGTFNDFVICVDVEGVDRSSGIGGRMDVINDAPQSPGEKI